MSEVTIKLKTPRFLNFVRLDGIDGDVSMSIGALSDDELEKYAEEWKQGLIEHAKSKREEYNKRVSGI